MTNDHLLSALFGLIATTGAVADMVKKHRYHGHPMDWRTMLVLTETVRLEAANLALIAERELEAANG